MKKADACICWICLKKRNIKMSILCNECQDIFRDIHFLRKKILFMINRDKEWEDKKFGLYWERRKMTEDEKEYNI